MSKGMDMIEKAANDIETLIDIRADLTKLSHKLTVLYQRGISVNFAMQSNPQSKQVTLSNFQAILELKIDP